MNTTPAIRLAANASCHDHPKPPAATAPQTVKAKKKL